MKKKILSVLMIAAVLLCYMPSTAFATGTMGGGTKPSTSAQQIGNYYEANDETGALPAAPDLAAGSTQQSYEDGKVLVNKTIKETNAENEFEVTLEVVTKDIEIKNVTSEDAAVVLVIDISGSMDKDKDKNKNKLSQAKKAAQTFINSFASDTANRRVAIVTFSGSDHDYFLNGATTVQTWTDASNLKTDNNNEVHSKISSINAKGGTNLEAGLQLAKNLLDDSQLNSISNKNIVLLTDGEPTYGINRTKETNYTTAINAICANGDNMIGNGYEENSDFHRIHTQVENLTGSIDANIGKYAVVIGDVILNCSGEKNSANYERKPGGGGAQPSQPSNKCLNNMSGQTWLATKCGFTAYTTSESDLDNLTSVFQSISELIKLQAQAWILTDPMGEYIDYNGLITNLGENDGFYYDSTKDEISWNLKQTKPVETKDETTGVTTRTYTLTYKIKLDNLKKGFNAEQYYATNKTTSLSYLITDSSTSTKPELKYAYFNVPSVKGLKADLTFNKTDESGSPLSGAVFTLSTGTYSVTATSDADGKVSFTNIPSGYTYKLEETTVPTGYEKAANKTVKVSYGALSSDGTYYDGTGAIMNESEKTSVSVTKVWNDSDNQDGKRPSSITVNLLANNEVKESKTVTAADNWSCTFGNLPKMAADHAISYTVTEDTVESYTTAITGSAAVGYTITNTHTPETTSVSGTKTWNDSDNQDGKRPSSITIRLHANGTENGSTTVKADVEWKYSFDNLPKYENGKEITYTITEDAVTGYTPNVSGYDVSNSYTPAKTSVTVTKAWSDNNNQDGKRPGSVTVQLYADNTASGEPVTLTAANNWTYTFTNLDKKSEGKDIVYTVKESTAIEGYTSSVSGDATTGFTITNTHTPETIAVNGTKTWDDNNNEKGERPSSITVKLLADGTATQTKTVNASDNWTYSFTELPKYANGTEIVYTVSEDAVPDYTAEVDGYNITNTYSNDTSVEVKVTKEWNDDDDKAGKRPDSVTVKLFANDKDTTKTVTLNESNGWKASFTDLEKYNNGAEIKYTVKEEPVENYTNVVSGNATDGFTVTNTYAPPKTSVKVTKIWDYGGNTEAADQPTPVKINLFADGESTGKTLELTANDVQQDGNWVGSFTDLDKYDETGKEITYTITEDAVDGYVSFVNGYTVTNAYNKTSVSVNKVWNDNNNEQNKRLKKVGVQLYANGTASGEAVELYATNEWKHTWTELTKYDSDGKEIAYTVKETSILPEGYTGVVSGDAATGFTITNTYTTPTPPAPTTGSLTITKTTNGAVATPDGATFILRNDDGTQVGSVTYEEVKEKGYTFTNLPFGNYTIEETNAAVDGYTLTTAYKVGTEETATAKVTNDGVPTIAISNVYEKNGDDTPTPPSTNTYPLTISKTVLGLSDVPADYAVTVTVANKYGTVRTITLKAGESQTIYLPYGEYTLTETASAVDGYTLTESFSDNGFVLSAGGKNVTITNTYEKVPEEPIEDDGNNNASNDKEPVIPNNSKNQEKDDTSADNYTSDVPKTGDEMPQSMLLYLLMAAGALIGIRKSAKHKSK